jgi:outer membrane protein assembly factor BamB
MVVGWPDKQDSYYCFDTSDGNVAWLRLNTYVSQPFSERRLIFDFTTYQ